jgi:nitrate reductase delta subunit
MNQAPLVDRLASLLEYPDATFSSTLAECCRAVDVAVPAAAAELDRFADAIDGLSTAALQELYVSTFDWSPRCTLDVGWHLFGDAYERGMLLAKLREELQRAQIPENGQLPDHLPSLLRLLDRVEPPRRDELTQLLTPALDALQQALASSKSPYAALVKGVVTTAIAGG